MECHEARDRFLELELEELGRQTETRVREHLEQCAACRQARAELEPVIAALRGEAARERARPAPAADLRALAPRRGRVLRWAARAALWLLAAAGAAAVLDLRVEGGDGRLAVAFRLPGARALAPAAAPAAARPVDPALVRQALTPALQEWADWQTAVEERRSRDLVRVVQWLEERRLEEARALAEALSDTRADLRWTRQAVVQLAAGRAPARRTEEEKK
jgi:hypothetical protein